MTPGFESADNDLQHLTEFCKNLAPEMLQLFHEIREKEEEKQKLDRYAVESFLTSIISLIATYDRQIDVLRRHKRDYEDGDLR